MRLLAIEVIVLGRLFQIDGATVWKQLSSARRFGITVRSFYAPSLRVLVWDDELALSSIWSMSFKDTFWWAVSIRTQQRTAVTSWKVRRLSWLNVIFKKQAYESFEMQRNIQRMYCSIRMKFAAIEKFLKNFCINNSAAALSRIEISFNKFTYLLIAHVYHII